VGLNVNMIIDNFFFKFIHSFILFSSRHGAHAYKKIKQYKPVRKERKKKKRINCAVLFTFYVF